MRNLFSQFLSLSLGAAVASKEQVEKVANELVAKGEISKNEAKEMIENLVKKGESTRKDMDELVKSKVQQALKELDLVTMEEYRQLEKRIEQLEKTE